MSNGNSQDDSIFLVDYNSDWIRLAEEEISVLKKIFHDQDWIIAIEHIGSTAIPGLAAKPIIDLYIGARSIEEAQQAIAPIKKLGYEFWEDNPNKEKLFFVKGMPPLGKGRTHHIHIVEYDSDYWEARILFRDYLRTHPKEVQRYAKLKHKLSKEHTNDREAYTDAKANFIESILKKAGFNKKVRR